MKTKGVNSASSAPASVRSVGGVGAAGGSGGANFASILAGQMGGAEVAAEAAAAVAVSSVAGVIQAQSVDDKSENLNKRKRTVKYGEELLDRLEEIRIALIKGIIPKERLYQLSQKLRQRNVEEINADPKLRYIIEEIEVRVEVELAKLTRSTVT